MVRFRKAGVLALAVLCVGVTACSAGSHSSDSGTARQPAPTQPFAPAAPQAGTERPGGEISTATQPLSTFGLDVDTASYTYAKAQLTAGRRPDRQQIRPEEFVNAFRQDYPQPAGAGFTITADGARLPESHHDSIAGDGATTPTSARLLRVGLQTRADSSGTRPDAALTFVVDVSGSMGDPGKLDLVKDALGTLVDQLRPTDSVAVVAYSGEAETIREMTAASDRDGLHKAIDRLRIGGSTNLEAGLVRGYDVARKGFRPGLTNRVVLLSDGLPNVGNTDAEPILREVREAAAKQIALLGVGVGTDYGDAFMETLADKGDGFVVYVSSTAEARRVFVEQLPATLAVRALDAKAQVEFDPDVVASYRLIGYDDGTIDPSAFRDDHADGGEVGPGHAVTALYALHLRTAGVTSGRNKVADIRVRWTEPASHTPTELTAPVTIDDVDRTFTSASPRLQVCYAAAYFAEVLHGGALGGEAKLTDLATIATRAATATEDADVATLADTIKAAQRLQG